MRFSMLIWRKVGNHWNTPAGRDVVWRSRAAKTSELLAKIILDPATDADDLPRYLRAFDFQPAGAEKEKAMVACLLAVSSAASATAADADKDNTIVELLLRLDAFDLEAHPPVKTALLRFLRANPGSEQFLRLIDRFQIKEFADVLGNLAVTKSGETTGVQAAQLLLKTGERDRLAATLAGDDEGRAIALVGALGNVGGQAVFDLVAPLIVDAARPVAVRSAGAMALGKSKPGQEYLLALVKSKRLPADLVFTVANVLLGSSLPDVRDEAGKYLQLPASADAKPLPPLAELVKLRGNPGHGRELFFERATCAKCHIVKDQGKEVGPNLSEIGSKLAKDALLVSILDPNAGISHNYEAWLAVTNDGKTVTGLLVSKTDSEVVLKDAGGIVYTLKLADVDELKKLTTSLMPADLQKLLTPQDLVDVVDYLTTLKKP